MLGVDSVERSLQEDTLLVLFNAAISNLVRWLYRDLGHLSPSFNRCSSGTTLPSVATLAGSSNRSSPARQSWIRQRTRRFSNLLSLSSSRQVLVNDSSLDTD